MTSKRQRGRKWAMLEAVATAMLHGWEIRWWTSWGIVLGRVGCRWELYIGQGKRVRLY